MKTNIDAVTLEIVKNALSSIADEMALVILRTAYSPIVRDSMDFSTAICDRQGRAIAQGLTLPIHLGSFPIAMRRLIEEQLASTRPGDVFIMNDPYSSGGMHLPDVYIILPIFHEGQVEAFAAAIVHHADIGGMAPGSMALHATEIYQEGLRIPLVKLYQEGKPNEALFSLLELNSRAPTQILGDLRAQIAACRACEKGILHLLHKYGSEAFNDFVEGLHDYAEKLTRQEIRAMPDGAYEFEDYIDGLGEDPQPIRFKVTVTVAGDEITIDWTGTSKQVAGAINGPIATTYSVAYAALRSAMGIDIPNSDGFARPVKLIAEPGSIVNPLAPAACAARGVIAYRMYDVLLGAFSLISPERIPASGEGGPSAISISGYESGKRWLITDGVLGSWGGRHTKDGVDGISSPLGNMSNQPVELIEARLPLKITRYELTRDSGGAGEHRGGLAITREYEVMGESADMSLRSDRRRNVPSGLNKGFPGSPTMSLINPGVEDRVLPVMPMGVLPLTRGDRFLHIAPGGAGCGDPLLRSPAHVLEDVIDEKISREFAEEIYGVVLKGNALEVDAAATEVKRSALRKRSRVDAITAQLRRFAETNQLQSAWFDDTRVGG